ncbi:Pantothenate synthetase [Desulfonema magnum]|uniref:Pantothenate synthetase n=2 Tax=Desulfonema magnum TaxID=45655 RepID=A0A975BMZ9_9BACT|nr:Pantothenate synthetase [Desulfonema magnum]
MIRRSGKTIAFVPTMGFLHEGHLSLMREGRNRCDDVVISIFVNPTQFGPGEDLESYPRSFERDCELAEKQGVNAIFAPNEKELYGKNFQTYVKLEDLPNHLCGISRPVHFRGVATVVTKLFNIVKPHFAIFGQKDYQQVAVIRQMVKDLNFDIEIVGHPTVRETDGLAMSSRNSYLTPDQRVSALSLYASLKKAQTLLENGITDAAEIIRAASELITSHPGTAIDYITICDPETLADMETISKPALMALAVKVGKTRVIDNMILDIPGSQR